MGSIVLGMIAGLLYRKHKQGHIDLTKSKVGEQCFFSLPFLSLHFDYSYDW